MQIARALAAVPETIFEAEMGRLLEVRVHVLRIYSIRRW
jgi:hypothetical protein